MVLAATPSVLLPSDHCCTSPIFRSVISTSICQVRPGGRGSVSGIGFIQRSSTYASSPVNVLNIRSAMSGKCGSLLYTEAACYRTQTYILFYHK